MYTVTPYFHSENIGYMSFKNKPDLLSCIGKTIAFNVERISKPLSVLGECHGGLVAILLYLHTGVCEVPYHPPVYQVFWGRISSCEKGSVGEEHQVVKRGRKYHGG